MVSSLRKRKRLTIYLVKTMSDFGATFFSEMSSRRVNHAELKKGWAGVDKPSYSEKQKEAFRRMMKKKIDRHITKTDGDGNEISIKLSKSEMKDFRKL